jgi:hypothetical protein
MKDAPEVPGDMILQNAEGIKNKFTFLTLRYSKTTHSRGS